MPFCASEGCRIRAINHSGSDDRWARIETARNQGLAVISGYVMIDPNQPQKGRVTNPATDRRLKENRGKFSPGPRRPKGMPWAQGRVVNYDTDRRLKKNRVPA